MIAVDTNLLVYAHRAESPHHARARDALRSLVERRDRWAVPWPCVHEFLVVVTHPRIYRPATTIQVGLEAVHRLLEMRGMTPLGESPDHIEVLGGLLRRSGVVGPKVHDARVAAICMCHGVEELWSADRDFGYFPELRVRNPLVQGPG